jgi:DNA-binding IclR family transcriptional regulator
MDKDDHVLQQGGYRAPAVHKAFQVLRMVAEAQRGLRIVELADRLGYSASTTHGLVHALLREKALIQGEGVHELLLGPLITELAFTDWNYLKVNELAQPILNEVRDRAEATVFLGVRMRTRVMITATAEAMASFKISAPVGTTIPLFAGAVGKVFLAQETTERIGQLVAERGLPRYTPNSMTNLEEYLAELNRVRFRGYAFDDEEYLAGVRAVAVALNNRQGLPTAIWVVGFAANMELKKLQQVANITVDSAKKLRSQLEKAGDAGVESAVASREKQPDR